MPENVLMSLEKSWKHPICIYFDHLQILFVSVSVTPSLHKLHLSLLSLLHDQLLRISPSTLEYLANLWMDQSRRSTRIYRFIQESHVNYSGSLCQFFTFFRCIHQTLHYLIQLCGNSSYQISVSFTTLNSDWSQNLTSCRYKAKPGPWPGIGLGNLTDPPCPGQLLWPPQGLF